MKAARQTERIHRLQREARTVAGIVADREAPRHPRHPDKCTTPLLKPCRIANDFAPLLTFTSERTRTRRDHEKYLTLIDTIALLHQHQREPIKKKVAGQVVEMIPVTVEDIEAANRIAPEVLGRSARRAPAADAAVAGEHQDVYVAKPSVKRSKSTRTASFLAAATVARGQTGSSETQVRAAFASASKISNTSPVASRTSTGSLGCLYELLNRLRTQSGRRLLTSD